MHPDHQHFFVIAAIENADVPTVWQTFHAAPKKIMIEIFSRRRFEGKHLATLRVDARHDMLNGAIFAGGVHGLKNQQHRPSVLRVKHVLQFRKRTDTELQPFLSPRFSLRLESQGVPRVNIWQKYQYDQGFRMCRSMAVPSIPLLNVVSYSFSQAGCGCFATTSAARLLCTSRIPYRSELRDSVSHAG